MQSRMKVEVKCLKGKRRGREEERFQLGYQHSKFLGVIVSKITQFEEIHTLSIALIPLHNAWLTMPYSGAVLHDSNQ